MDLTSLLLRVVAGTTSEQVNLGVAHRFEDARPITLRADVVNLLDETYLSRSQTDVGVFAPAFGARRMIYAGITKEF